MYPWILPFLVLSFVFFIIKKSSKIEQVFSKEILNKLQNGPLGGKNLKFYLLVLSFILMILALGRPVLLDEKKELNEKSFNFIIVLDISKSMEANDIFPTRLAFAKKAIYEIMDRVSEANIAIIAYANDAFLVSPFSNDFNSIKFLLSNLDSNSLSSKGSQILSALKAANRVFESSNNEKKVILLVSDGADGRDLKKIKEYILKNKITLHALTVGTKKGSILKNYDGSLIKDNNTNIVVSKRDDSLIKVLNGGAYLSSSGELTKLDWLVGEIKKSVDKRDVKRGKFEGAKELFYYPLSLSLLFIFFAFNSLKVPFLVALLFIQTDSRAGILDFVEIYKANKSYENKDYQEAEKGFSKISSKSAKYNQANALYRQKKYKEALKVYDSIDGFSKTMEYKRLHNIGNTYANLGKIDDAIKSYKEALKLKDDKDTKANLRYMKKKKKKEQEQKKQNKKGNQKPKDNKKKKKQKNPNGKNETKNKKKQNKKEEKKAQQSPKKEQKKISETEAKKWDKRMNKKKFKTKPMTLKKGEQNEIYW
jgi:Ca-activated chloride channel family protein